MKRLDSTKQVVEHKKTATNADLERVLIRYEGAVSACERDGDESDEAVAEMESARAALMDILRQALALLP